MPRPLADKQLFTPPDEETVLMRRYRAWRRQQRDELLAGEYGPDLRALARALNAATPWTEQTVVDHVAASRFAQASRDVRSGVVRMVQAGLARNREKQGLAPMDDPLWGDWPDDWTPGAFGKIKRMMGEG